MKLVGASKDLFLLSMGISKFTYSKAMWGRIEILKLTFNSQALVVLDRKAAAKVN